MSTATSKYGLVKPATSDNIGTTVGTDLPANFQKIEDILVKAASVNVSALSTGLPVVSFDSPVGGGLNFEMTAQPLLVNVLGNDGDCEDTSKFNVYQSTISLDTTNKVFGTNCIKSVKNTNYLTMIYKTSLKNLIGGKKIFLSAYMKVDANESINFQISSLNGGGGATYAKQSVVNVTTTMARYGAKMSLADSGTNELYPWIVKSIPTAATAMYVDGFMINVISDDEYANLTADQLLAKYPYVNGIQPMIGLNVRACGKNLIEERKPYQFGSYILPTWTGNKIRFDNSANTGNRSLALFPVYLQSGKKYYISKANENIISGSAITSFGVLDSNKVSLGTMSTSYIATYTGLHYIQATTSMGTLQVIEMNIMLEEGLAITTYEPFKSSELLVNNDFLGTSGYSDKIAYKNDAISLIKNVKKLLLDGDLTWSWNADGTGWKAIYTPYDGVRYTEKTQRYDGSIIAQMSGVSEANQTNSDGGYLRISIADVDSGWGETYQPLAAEMKACMNGWKMNNGTFGTPYNGTGTKTWTLWNATSNTGAVTTCPTTKATGWTAWATLWYALSTPLIDEFIDVKRDGLNSYSGVTTIVLRTGIIQEKANMVLSDNGAAYGFNIVGTAGWTNCPQLYKIKKILSILKDGLECSDFTINSGTAYSYGYEYGTVPVAKYNPNSVYEVIYEIYNELYNSQQAEFNIDYSAIPGETIERLVQAVAMRANEITQLIRKKFFGSSAFSGTTGVTITHNFGHTRYDVVITPKANPAAYWYVEKNANNIVVKTSAACTVAFDYLIQER